MPLDKIRTSHVGTMLCRSSAIVPKFERNVFDRFVKWSGRRPGEDFPGGEEVFLVVAVVNLHDTEPDRADSC